jgi:quinoprotein glucose dehydrogenase
LILPGIARRFIATKACDGSTRMHSRRAKRMAEGFAARGARAHLPDAEAAPRRIDARAHAERHVYRRMQPGRRQRRMRRDGCSNHTGPVTKLGLRVLTHMSPPTRSPFVLVATGALYALLGLVFCVGGAVLLWRDGSAYYLLAGAGLLLCAALVWRGRAAALSVAAALLFGTVAWSVWEVQFDWWQLLPRIDVWFGIAAWLMVPAVRRHLGAAVSNAEAGHRTGGTLVWAALGASALVALFSLSKDYDTIDGVLPARGQGDATMTSASKDWTGYGSSSRGDRYAPANQITPDNVKDLKLAWTFHTGDFKGPDDPGEIANEVTPLKANGKLYVCTPHNQVIALDPDSGREIWRFDPHINRKAKAYQHMICRGVSYYDATAAGNATAEATRASAVAACPRRIYAPTADATIVAINADTGEACTFFGTQGAIDLKVGVGKVALGVLNPTSPPLTTARVLVAAASVTDNDSTDEPSGVVRGYDIDSGKLLWNWDSGNPDETTPLPPGPHLRAQLAEHVERGERRRSAGTRLPAHGQPDARHLGRQPHSGRRALQQLRSWRWTWRRARCDGSTRRSTTTCGTWTSAASRAWSTSTRLAARCRRWSRRRSAATCTCSTAATARCSCRRRSNPVPQGAAEGDHTSPTQPFSALSYKPERKLEERDMWGTSAIDQMVCRIVFKGLRYDGIFTPPSEQGSIVYPGNYGVFDWGGVAIDPVRQVLVGNPNYMAFVSKLHRRDTIERPRR